MFYWKKKNRGIDLVQVADYWARYLTERGVMTKKDGSDLICWRCKSDQQVAAYPIVSKKWSKTDVADHLLLCSSCQVDKPDVQQAGIVWDWLAREEDEHYWILQGMAEYERIYHKTVLQEMWDMGVRDGDEVGLLAEKVMALAYKQNERINRATLAGLFRLELDKMRRQAFANWTGILRLAS